MAENETKKSVLGDGEESVDDILAEILNADGTFNEDFNGLFAKYVVGVNPRSAVQNVDISDRSDEYTAGNAKVTYDSGEFVSSREKNTDERIEEKIPDSVREVYSEASSQAQRPEFTSTGDVKYPTMGVGASEQRVVFDADWEETAKKEAARLERVRQDRLLRGDSTYARTFVAGGMYMPRKNPYVNSPGANPLYIDPLSRDEDFDTADSNSQYYSSQKKSFFPEGFSVVQKSNGAASGKTERRNGGNVYSSNNVSRADMTWLQVEEKSDKKKKRRLGKRKLREEDSSHPIADAIAEKTQQSESTANVPTENVTENVDSVHLSAENFDNRELEMMADETQGLRSTVAEIVDKYNKRNEEEAKRKREEELLLEERRREEELRERLKEEELRKLKKEISPEIVSAMESDSDEFSGEYEDFSTEPNVSEEAEQTKTQTKAYGVVFTPEAIEENNYLEKITDEEPDTQTESAENSTDGEEENEQANGNKKRKSVFSKRRKDN